jgi:ATP-dependent protease ClpP protease subunit
MIGDIFIYHGIGREKGEVSAEMFRNELNQNKDAESIKIHFHTPGGDVFEGFNMYNTLMNFKATTGKKVIGIVESVCASIGTLVLGACDEIVMNKRDSQTKNYWRYTIVRRG